MLMTFVSGDYGDDIGLYMYKYDVNKNYLSTTPYNHDTTNNITDDVSACVYIRLLLREKSGATAFEISPDDGPDLVSISYHTMKTDTTLTIENMPADSKAVGDRFNESNYAYAMTSILCIGDSLTRGSSPEEDWGTSTGTVPIYQNYPYMLGRMINAQYTNAGFSGISASTWYENWADTITPVDEKPYKVPHYNFANYDTFIIWFGTNNGLDPDDLDTDGTEANYYCKIIDAILTDYAAGHTDERYGDTPLIILCKCFATKSGYSLTDTNIAIEAIATRYGLPIIDNSDLSQTDRPELHENKNNVHFGKAGYIFIANRVIKKMNEWFLENPTRADYAQTQFQFVIT